MQIQGLNIDRFGRKNNLDLDGIGNQLNVVYGPNGAGKSTAINFLRWMLYGNYNDQVGQYVGGRYRNADGNLPVPASGSVTFTENGYSRRIARQDDGSRYGHVAIDNDDRYARQSHHLTSLLGDVSQSDFDLLFTPDFSRDYALAELLQGSMARGIDLVSQRIPSDRVQELRLRIDNYRRDMDALPWRSGELTALLEQKRTLERRIDTITEEMRRRRAEYDLEYEELNRRIQDAELDIQRLRNEWHARDNDVAARRRELEEAWANAEEAKKEYVRRRRNELSEMEAHITRVRAMQADIQRRYDRLQISLRDKEVNLDRRTDVDESACLVQSISKQLDEMRSIDYPESDYVNRYRSTYRHRGARAPMTASFDHLRNEVGRLCETLQRERGDDRVRAMADELDQLRECEAMMQRWLTGLISQRDQLANEIDEAERHGVSLVIDDPDYRRDLNREYDRLRDLEIYEPLRSGRLRAVQHSCDGFEPIDPVSDELLIKLTRQRDSLHDELQTAERLLQQLMQRRHDLEAALTRLNDRELESARRELAEMESLIRAAEERERLQRLIGETEVEISRLRDTVRNSPVTDHAAKILHRLTAGHYSNIRIDSTRNISVEDAAGNMVPVEHISRGVRDQVYLSFCLALITEYRRRGVRLPFVLNDAFVNVDSQSDDRLATVLAEFAGMGQQVLVFTRHQHVSDMMQRVGAQYLELKQRVAVQPVQPVAQIPLAPVVRTESIDQVRFRPRSEVDFGTSVEPPRRTFPEANVVPQEFVQPPVVPQNVMPQNVIPQNVIPRTITQPTSVRGIVQGVRRVDPAPARPVQQPRMVQSPAPPTPRTAPVFDDYREFDETASRRTTEYDRPATGPTAAAYRKTIEPTTTLPPVQHLNAPASNMYTSTLHAPDSVAVNETLSRNTLIHETGTVDADLATRLRNVGIVTVDDFLQAAPAQVEQDVDGWGLSARPIRRWQTQLALRVFVAGIGAEDARILVACGIDSPSILANADVDVLCDRVIQLLTTQRGGNGTRTREQYRSRIQNWITAAGRTYRPTSVRDQRSVRNESSPPFEYPDREAPLRERTRGDLARLNENRDDYDYDRDDYDNYDDETTGNGNGRSRTSYRSSSSSSSSGGSGSGSGSGHGSGSGSGHGSGSGSGTGRGSGSGSGSSRRSSSRSSRSSSRSSSSRSSRSERAPREPREPREPRTSRKRSERSERTSRSSRSSRTSDKPLRFYLGKSDPVVDAPTIGPKMAERLHKIGIHTVDDLLSSKAHDIANRLDYDKVDADEVKRWQQQTNLACRIPKMRGHDAQILVACGISDPAKLSAMDADSLWAIVKPFIKTSEAKRIIRNGKAPDKAEIRDWIEWAQSSRTLAAA